MIMDRKKVITFILSFVYIFICTLLSLRILDIPESFNEDISDALVLFFLPGGWISLITSNTLVIILAELFTLYFIWKILYSLIK